MRLRPRVPFGGATIRSKEWALRLIPGFYPHAPKRNAITSLLYVLLLGTAVYLVAHALLAAYAPTHVLSAARGLPTVVTPPT